MPKHIDSRVILEAVSPNKDADGFHPYNFGRLVEGHPVFEACTPKGVIKMIESTGVSIEGKRAVVVGRSNIVGKPLALNKRDVDLVALIREVVGLARQKAVEQGIAIEVSEATPIPRLQADPVQIKTCLMNVVLNAIQAMPAGGRLRVTTQHRAEARREGHAIRMRTPAAFRARVRERCVGRWGRDAPKSRNLEYP